METYNLRGVPEVTLSGLKIRKKYAAFDAQKVFGIELTDSKEPMGCACGEILLGIKTPLQCPLYQKKCTPIHPIGPCMVSSEGTCAAFHRYHSHN